MGKKLTGEDKLLRDVDRLAAQNNEKGFKTREAYKGDMKLFARFYWRNYHGQKLCNIEGKHMTKMGRPRKDDAKRASITIRMSKETHKKLNEYASKHELSMTEVALRSLEEYLSKKK